MTNCDLLISARWLLPIAPRNEALEHHALAIQDGRIQALGPADQIRRAWQAEENLELDHHILLPGLVNAHGHAAMTLLRGAGEDQHLQDWLHHTIWPLEAEHVNAEFVRLGSELAIAEMLASGTTTFSDMYFFPEVVAAAVEKTGMRAQLAFPVIEFTNAWSTSVDDCLHKGLALHDQYRHHPRIDMAFGPHAPYTVRMADLKRVAMYADEIEAPIQIHLHENAREVADAVAEFGKTWIHILDEEGLLGPQMQAVHMTQVNDEDLERIAATNTRVIHCPSSNLKLASGYADITRLAGSDVCIGLGTDGAASNNTLDLFHEARMAALLAKHHGEDAALGPAREMLAMATLGGADALGIADLTGSLEAGKAADLVAVDSRRLQLSPLHDPFAALIHSHAGNAVSDVFIQGERVVADGRHTHLDVDELLAETNAWLLQTRPD